LVDMPDLGSGAERRESSSLSEGTKMMGNVELQTWRDVRKGTH